MENLCSRNLCLEMLRLGRLPVAMPRIGTVRIGMLRAGLLDVGARCFGILCLVSLATCRPVELPAEWTLEAEELRTLGQEPVDAATAFFNPAAVGFDAQNRIHVLDTGNHRVQIFSPAGDLVASRGRRGNGPGELSGPEGMWVYPSGEILIADTGNRRLARFGPAGEPLDAVAVDYLPLEVMGTAEHIFVLRLPPASFMFGPAAEPLVTVLDRDGTHLDSIVPPQPSDVGILYFLLNTRRIAPAPGGGFALAHTHVTSQVQLYDRLGTPTATIDTLYKAASWAPLGRLPRHISDQSLDRVARTATDVAWDASRGLYWVLAGYVDRTSEGTWTTGTELYRYDTKGVYRGSVMLPYAARVVAPAPDRTVWLIDEEGVLHQLRLRDPDLAPPLGEP